MEIARVAFDKKKKDFFISSSQRISLHALVQIKEREREGTRK
jgi:hypothetical protein